MVKSIFIICFFLLVLVRANLLLNGIVTDQETYGNYYPAYAIDGDIRGANYYHATSRLNNWLNV